MTGCRDFFIRRIVASRTRYVFFPTLFRTSCRLSFMLYFIMAKRITFRLSASFAGLRFRTSSVFPIVRQFFNRFVMSAQYFVPMIFAIRRPFRCELMFASCLFKLDIVQVNFARLQRKLNNVFTFFQSDIAEAVTRIRANPPLFQILAADQRLCRQIHFRIVYNQDKSVACDTRIVIVYSKQAVQNEFNVRRFFRFQNEFQVCRRARNTKNLSRCCLLNGCAAMLRIFHLNF